MKTKLFYSLAICWIFISSCSTNENDITEIKVDQRGINEDSIALVFNNWKKEFEKENEIQISDEDTFRIILTDVDNDGYNDGLVDFNLFVPKDFNWVWNMGYIYFRNTSEGIKYQATLDGRNDFLGNPQRLVFISNKSGDLKMKAYRYFSDDPTCCPSISTTEHFKFDNGKFIVQDIEEEKDLLSNEYYSYGPKKEITARYIDYGMGDLSHYVFKIENSNKELDLSSLPSYARNILSRTVPNSEYDEEEINPTMKNKLFRITYREFSPRSEDEFMYPYTGATSIVPLLE